MVMRLRNPLTFIALLVTLGLVVAGCTLVPQLFPVANQHPAGWRTEHGRVVLSLSPSTAKVGNGMTCDQCHTTAMATGSATPAPSKGSNVTCFSCHSSGSDGSPHASDWKMEHGPYVVRSGGATESAITNADMGIQNQTCNTCHTVIKNGDGTIPPSPKAKSTCFTCHATGPSGSPHADDWRRGHLQVVYTTGDKSCAACHTTTKEAGKPVAPSPKAQNTCFTCHELRGDGAPHVEAAVWGVGGLHATIVKKYGYSRPFVDENGMPHEACATCHTVARDASGSIPPSPSSGRTCFECHEGPNGR